MIAVFRKALHDSWRVTSWLLIGLALYLALLMAFYPTLVAQSAEMDEMIRKMPKQVIGVFVSGDIEDFSLSDPAQFLQIRYATFLVLIVGSIAIAQAFNAVINAERDGTLDVMLSLPLSRRAYLLGRMLHTAAMLVIVIAGSYLLLAACTVIITEFDIALDDLALAVFGGFFPLATVAAFAYMLSVLVPSSKGYAGAVTYLMLIGSYLVYGFAATVDALHGIRPLLLFHYYNAAEIVHSGLKMNNLLVLSGTALVYGVIAWWYLDKKELGV